MEVLWSFNTRINFSSCKEDRLLAIMTGSVSFSPKKTYFKWSRRVFNSNLGACKIDGNNFSLSLDKEIKEEVYPIGLGCISIGLSCSKLFLITTSNVSSQSKSKICCAKVSRLSIAKQGANYMYWIRHPPPWKNEEQSRAKRL